MWQAEKSLQAQSKLENLKELIRFMEEFNTLAGFMEHVSLVMDAESEQGTSASIVMTLHSAKGLKFDVVFLPGWDGDCCRISAASMRPAAQLSKRSGRLAHVGHTRARLEAKITFAQNRRTHGMWQQAIPSPSSTSCPWPMSRLPRSRLPWQLRAKPLRQRRDFVRERFLRDARLAESPAEPAAW